MPNVATADRTLRKQLIVSVLFDDKVRALLRGFHSVPIRPNGILWKPFDLIHPHADMAIFYDEQDSWFPLFLEYFLQGHTRHEVYSKLVDVGMKGDWLSWKELGNRSSIVTQKLKTCFTKNTNFYAVHEQQCWAFIARRRRVHSQNLRRTISSSQGKSERVFAAMEKWQGWTLHFMQWCVYTGCHILGVLLVSDCRRRRRVFIA